MTVFFLQQTGKNIAKRFYFFLFNDTDADAPRKSFVTALLGAADDASDMENERRCSALLLTDDNRGKEVCQI